MKKFLISSVLLLTLSAFGKAPIDKVNKKTKNTNVVKYYPCHPSGDLGPCSHIVHFNGDLGPCTHFDWQGNRIHSSDIYACKHREHTADIYTCTHICY